MREAGLAKRIHPVKVLGRWRVQRRSSPSAPMPSAPPRAGRSRAPAEAPNAIERRCSRFASGAGRVLVLQTIANAFAVPEIRRKHPPSRWRCCCSTGSGSIPPAPGVDIDTVESIEDNFTGNNVPGSFDLFSGGSLQRLSLFALGDHALHHRLDHPPAADVVVPALERLQKEGEVGQQKITQYTRYLTVGLAFGQSLGYVFLFRSFQDAEGTSVVGDSTFGKVFLIVIRPTAGHDAVDVARRADDPARDRQRDLADDLRLDHLLACAGQVELVEQPRSGLRRDDAVPRPRGDRRHRLRSGGRAPDLGAGTGQARRRPADDDRRFHVPAAAGEHGRGDPGHLRRLDHGLPAHDRPGRSSPPPRSTSPPSSPPTGWPTSSARPSSSSSSPTSTPRSPSTRSTRRTT